MEDAEAIRGDEERTRRWQPGEQVDVERGLGDWREEAARKLDDKEVDLRGQRSNGCDDRVDVDRGRFEPRSDVGRDGRPEDVSERRMLHVKH